MQKCSPLQVKEKLKRFMKVSSDLKTDLKTDLANSECIFIVLFLCATANYIYIYIYITCTEENRLPTNKNFIQTQCVSASAFIRGLYIGFIK